MKADDLRASILQAAIQGKLTKQDPNDEPASVLVERIREEKHRLVKEGKIKKDKNESFIFKRDGSWFETINGKDERCIDDEIPFEIPDNWTWSRLNSVCDQIVDCPHSTPHYIESETGFYAIDTNCFDRSGKITHFRNLSKNDYESRISRLSPTSGDIVYSREGVVGYAAILPNNRKICLGQRVMLFRPSQFIHSEWIRTIVSHSFFIDVLLSESKGIGVKHVNVGDIKLLLIPIPPSKKQSSIISVLDRAYSLIDDFSYYEQKTTILDSIVSSRITTSILQYALQGNLTKQNPDDEPASVLVERIREEKHRLVKEGKIKKDKNESFIFKRDGSWFETINGKDERCIDDEIPFDIPDNWIFSRMSSVSILKSGVDLSSDKYNDQGKGIVYITGASNIKENGVLVNRWTEHPKIIANLGDILLVCKGSTGKCTISDVPVAHIARQIMAITPISISARYLLAYFKLIESKLNGASKGTIPGIERRDVLSLLVPIPPMNEQKNIINSIDRLMELIESLRNPWEF